MQEAIVLAVDGGLDVARAAGLRPAGLIGDLAGNWLERKKSESEEKLKVARAKAVAEINWDIEMARANQDALFNDPTSFVGGNPDGDITIVEFMDYFTGMFVAVIIV